MEELNDVKKHISNYEDLSPEDKVIALEGIYRMQYHSSHARALIENQKLLCEENDEWGRRDGGEAVAKGCSEADKETEEDGAESESDSVEEEKGD